MKSLLACLTLISCLAVAGGALACDTHPCRSDDAATAMTAPPPCSNPGCIVAPPPCQGNGCLAANTPPPCACQPCVVAPTSTPARLAANTPPPCQTGNCIVDPARADVEMACMGSACVVDTPDESKVALAAPQPAGAFLALKTPALA